VYWTWKNRFKLPKSQRVGKFLKSAPARTFLIIVIDPATVAKTNIAKNLHNGHSRTDQTHFTYCDGGTTLPAGVSGKQENQILWVFRPARSDITT
jgi:hypothetical protein